MHAEISKNMHHLQNCQITLDISESPIENQNGAPGNIQGNLTAVHGIICILNISAILFIKNNSADDICPVVCWNKSFHRHTLMKQATLVTNLEILSFNKRAIQHC